MSPAMAVGEATPPAKTPAQRFDNLVGLCPVVLVHSGDCKRCRVIYDMFSKTYKAGQPMMVNLAPLDDAWAAAVAGRSDVPLPQVWIGGSCVGSYKEMVRMDRSGALREMLRDLAVRRLSLWQREAQCSLRGDAPEGQGDVAGDPAGIAQQRSVASEMSEASRRGQQ